jgi:hypothetical protein
VSHKQRARCALHFSPSRAVATARRAAASSVLPQRTAELNVWDGTMACHGLSLRYAGQAAPMIAASRVGIFSERAASGARSNTRIDMEAAPYFAVLPGATTMLSTMRRAERARSNRHTA